MSGYSGLCEEVAFFLVTDVSDIKYVINFDFPSNTEDYIHRIGRTARAKNTGTAYSFFTKNNAKQAKELIEIIREAKQPVTPRLYEMMDLAKQMMHLKQRQRYNRARGNDRLANGGGFNKGSYGNKANSSYNSSSSGMGGQYSSTTGQASAYANGYSSYTQQPTSTTDYATQSTATYAGNMSRGILPTPGATATTTSDPNVYQQAYGGVYQAVPGVAYQSFQQQTYTVPATGYYLPQPPTASQPPPPPPPTAQPPPPPPPQ